MQKKGISELLTVVIILSLVLSLSLLLFYNINKFSYIEEVKRSVVLSQLVEFRVVSIKTDDLSDKLTILIENQENQRIDSFSVSVFNKLIVQNYDMDSVDSFDSKWFELDYENPSEISKIEIIPQIIKEQTLMIYTRSKRIVTKDQIKAENSQIIIRDLICHKCGNHKAPPTTPVEMRLNVFFPNSSDNLLTDLFSKDWAVMDSKGGIISSYDSYFNQISWGYNDQMSYYSYTILSPELTSPPTKYLFKSEFDSISEDYNLIVSDPSSSDYVAPSNNITCSPPCFGSAIYTIDFNDLKNINDSRILKFIEEKYRNDWIFGPTSSMIFNLSFPRKDVDQINITLYCNQTSSDLEDLNVQMYNYYTSTWNILGRACNKTAMSYYYFTVCPTDCSLNSNAQLFVNLTSPQVSIRFSDSVKDKVKSIWNLDYISLEAINISTSIAMSLSQQLANGITWVVDTLPAVALNATGNQNQTLYNIEISTVDGNADLYIKANSSLISGPNQIGLGNETFSFSTTDPQVLGQPRRQITTNFIDNKIGSNITNVSIIYLKFYLDVPASQLPGIYFNNVLFRAVEANTNP